ncbi:MAG: hypothetical protein LAT50_21410 [Ectothiorhodospiraceae bacterium]|nr:hypothetical protein [Ectothiorhodospiraceae bacterium]
MRLNQAQTWVLLGYVAAMALTLLFPWFSSKTAVPDPGYTFIFGDAPPLAEINSMMVLVQAAVLTLIAAACVWIAQGGGDAGPGH